VWAVRFGVELFNQLQHVVDVAIDVEVHQAQLSHVSVVALHRMPALLSAAESRRYRTLAPNAAANQRNESEEHGGSTYQRTHRE